MKPINFKYAQRFLQPSGAKYSENVTGVDALPIFSDGEQVVSCWKMSWAERFSALFFGKVWLAILSENTHHPAYIVATKEYLKES